MTQSNAGSGDELAEEELRRGLSRIGINKRIVLPPRDPIKEPDPAMDYMTQQEAEDLAVYLEVTDLRRLKPDSDRWIATRPNGHPILLKRYMIGLEKRIVLCLMM